MSAMPTDMLSPGTDASFNRLKTMVIEHTGLAYYEDREDDLARTVRTRLLALALPDCTSYLERLNDNRGEGGELDALTRELTVGETYFFRHRAAFDAMRDVVLPEVVERNRDRRQIRVWSAGCSIGAEAYSLSIAIHAFLGREADKWDIQIVGTDINRDALDQARCGLFNEWALRSLSPAERAHYFAPHEERWRIASEFSQCVTFQWHNLVADAVPSADLGLHACDIILCRNVMIYFNEHVCRQVIGRFYRTLSDDGWLLVGHAENRTDLFAQFRTVKTNGLHVYKKSSRGSDGHVRVATRREQRRSVPPPEPSQLAPRQPAIDCRLRLPLRDTFPAPGPAAAAVFDRDNVCQTLTRILSHADSGRLKEAVKQCAALMDSRPLDAQIAVHMALLMEQLGEIQEASEWLRKALFLDRQCILAHYLMGQIEAGCGDTAAALRRFKIVLQLTAAMLPDNVVDGSLGLTSQDLRNLATTHILRLNQQ